jgi:hypothetical protein
MEIAGQLGGKLLFAAGVALKGWGFSALMVTVLLVRFRVGRNLLRAGLMGVTAGAVCGAVLGIAAFFV